MMTTTTTTKEKRMSPDEYWSKIAYHSSNYLDEISLNFINDVLDEDIISFNPSEINIKQEHEELSPSSLPFEVNRHSQQASSSNSPPREVYPLNFVCGVCSAPAYGYNFDQITCESCKAFFRRNALRDTSRLKCRFGGTCLININTRRQCTYCRLKKCFDIKMRKDWIRTDEERELRQLRNLQKQQRKFNRLSSVEQPVIDLPIVIRKKKRLMQTIAPPIGREVVIQRIEPISRLNVFGIHRHLSNDDTILLNNIQNAYKHGADRANFSHITRFTSTSSLAQFLNDESVNHQSLIYYYKQVSEFKQFDIDDQILLIKCNMIDLIHLHHIIIQNFQEPPQMGDHMSKWISPDFHEQMSRTRSRFDRFMKYPMILQIALIVFVFSINLSTPRGSTQFLDYRNRRKLYENQNIYLTILWRYLNYLFDETEAIRSIEILVMQILRYQKLMYTMDEALRKNNAHQDIFSPLMQSIFGLT